MKISGVLLAAGAARRFGRPKALLSWQGEALVARAARALLEAGAHECLVVLGSDAAEVRAALGDLPVRCVKNPRWEAGMGASIAAGVAAASGDACLVTLADQPGVDAALLARLIAASREGHPRVACRYADTLGVPALFSDADDLATLRKLDGDRGARALLASAPERAFALDAPEAAFDIDDEADWERWQLRNSRSP
ncbi:MAG: nucleotidyltransferase family protein [Myxococcota bacterium]